VNKTAASAALAKCILLRANSRTLYNCSSQLHKHKQKLI